ncbi:hypothetical protein QVD17_36672 [Tagetes erecta]|uniref:Uncharacterized protein n=1 Tax=Tagetes erecta TaxID=13708 RepID=A0AAD8JUJ8_TARER|nr:hypothetical protein QVD17_36672 [Tagetes erecta]
MDEAQRFINPCLLHFQKLGLELKCPLCLHLFNRPVLLPCNHIFCNLCRIGSECPVCKHSYIDQEVKPAPFIENIVTIYRNLQGTFNANVIHPDVRNGSAQCFDSLKIDVNNKLKKENVDAAKEENSDNGQSTTLHIDNGSAGKMVTPESVQKQEFKMSGCDKSSRSISKVQTVNEKHMETVVDGAAFIQMKHLSPPLSSDSQDVDGSCSDPTSSHKNSAKNSTKRAAKTHAYGSNLESNGKRQKKANLELDDIKLEANDHSQTNGSASENVTTAGFNPDTKSEKPLSGGQSDYLDLKMSPCAFCHSTKITDGSGALVSYARGKQVVANATNFSKLTYVHEKCTDWAPQIYFQNGFIRNLESEVARANKLKCSNCGKKGAVLGCYMKSCQKTYHVPCAYDIPECRWDCVDFLLLCPKHASHKFPKERKSKTEKQAAEKGLSTNLNPCTTLLNHGKKVVLCGSALSPEQKFHLADFARRNGASVSKYWTDNVTHVIAATDSNGACTRTLKVLMAILHGKWIVTMEWIKACVEAGHLVNEEPYEVNLDTHGCSGGPKSGRLRALNNAPKILSNMKFYFVGDFVQAFKDDLINLVKTAGGTIIETKDQLTSNNNADVNINEVTLVIYNADLSNCDKLEDEDSVKSQRLAAAKDVARVYGSRVIGHTWILESIAACTLLPFTSRA